MELSDRKAYEEFYSLMAPYADYSFNNLMIWLDLNDDLFVSRYDRNLVFRFTDVLDQNKMSYAIIGLRNYKKAIAKLFEYQKVVKIEQIITMVPEFYADALNDSNKQLIITEDKDNKEYIFDTSKSYILSGKESENLRYKINYFIKHYGDDVLVKEINLNDDKDRNILINAMHKWGSHRSIQDSNTKLGVEGLAIDKYLRIYEHLSSRCLAIFLSNEVIGFSIFHLPPHKNYAIGEHIKCDYKYRYIFDFIYYCTITRLHSNGIRYINGEQDLGIPGIRKHKQEMKPIGYFKKYNISPKYSLPN